MTTLPEAQAEFEREFKAVRTDPSARDVLHLYSGGVVPDIKTTAPCLCSSEELAIELWRHTAGFAMMDWYGNLTADKRKTWPLKQREIVVVWRQPPKIIKFQMTMTDLKKQDRVVTDRYTVYCEVAFSL